MQKRRVKWRGVFLAAVALVAVTAWGQVPKKAQNTLDDLSMASARLQVQGEVVSAQSLRQERAAMESPELAGTIMDFDRFLTENGSAWTLLLDRRSGRPAVVEGSGIPWLAGKGNTLEAAGLGETSRRAVIRMAKGFIGSYPDLFGVPVEDLALSSRGTGEYGGYLWYVQFQRTFHGIPVERSYVVFRVNNGNLVQFGGEFLGRIDLDPHPFFGTDTARQIVAGYVGGMGAGDTWLDDARLTVLPTAPDGDPGFYAGRPGQGVEYRLVYTLSFRRDGVLGTWAAKVDAHTGEVLAFADANEYGSITGGVYINSNADAEVVRPLGFVTVTNVTTKTADAGGNYTYDGGTATAALTGKYVKTSDACGTSSLSATTTPGNLAWGTSTGTDCTTPGVGGLGNTHSSRTNYYHLTLWKEKAIAWLPSNAWLPGTLTSNVNINDTCNAYWDGTSVNFFKSGGGCSNTGELPTVFLHEAGHGLDKNDGSPTSTVGSSESYGDTMAYLMTHQSCVGINFIPGTLCGGYGNPCTACTGIRDVDYAKHTYSTSPATPAQLNATTGFHCSTSRTYPGPCGYEGHCESYIMSEVGWDLATRDLPAAGVDANTAWFITDRLFYLSRPTAGEAYTCPTITTTNGCGTSNWFTVYRTVDDDNGNLADGTPHAAAIYAAFNRHLTACTTVVNTSASACASLGQPVLTATAGTSGVALSWPAVANATKYTVLRNEIGATAGLNIIASVTGTATTDAAVAPGVTYYYTVQAVGSTSSCFGALAAIQSVTAVAPVTYTVSGTITLSGAGLSGVTVSTTGATATTDTSGNYTLTGLTSATYTVTPSKSGYSFTPASQSVTVSGANVTGINFTATVLPMTQILLNPDFELGNNGNWTVATSTAHTVIGSATVPVGPHGGTYDASLCAYNGTYYNKATDSIRQTVTIPSTATAATLDFWYYIKTLETTTTSANDKLTVTVENTSGTVLGTPLTLSNLNKTTAWTQRTGLSLLTWKGQTVVLRFKGTTNTKYGTAFLLDDLALNVTQ